MLKKITRPLLAILFALNTYSVAQATELQAGRQYTELSPAVEDAPEVVEFFSFYCPPCAAFAGRYNVPGAIEKVLPAGSRIVKYHVGALGKFGKELTEAWSVARVLGVESKVEPLLFQAVQEKRSIKSKADIRQIFIDAGVLPEHYDIAIESMLVRSDIARQIQAAEKFGVTGTPAFFVKGKYLVRNNGISATTEDGYATAFADLVSGLLRK